MMSALCLIRYVDAQIRKEATHEINDKHAGHNAKNRTIRRYPPSLCIVPCMFVTDITSHFFPRTAMTCTSWTSRMHFLTLSINQLWFVAARESGAARNT